MTCFILTQSFLYLCNLEELLDHSISCSWKQPLPYYVRDICKYPQKAGVEGGMKMDLLTPER